MRRTPVLIGVDVGGTTISGGLVTREGEILSVTQRPTHGNRAGTAIEAMLVVVEALLAEARGRGLPLQGIGLGMAGVVDPEAGMILGTESYLLPELTRVPIAERVRARTGLPTFVDNDVNALALGESAFGLARGAASLVLLAIGTGVGGGIILDGVLVRGRAGYGGEFGHVTVNLDGRRCACGGRGCLDAYVGGHQLATRARAEVEHRADSALLALANGDAAGITAELVFDAADRGDPLARTIVDEACEALAAALGAIVNALNPELIVVTGGVAASLLPREAEILERTRKYAFAAALGATRIHVSAGNKRQTVRGGAALVLYETRRHERRRPEPVPGDPLARRG